MSELTQNTKRGVIAGVPATLVLSVFMLMENVIPQFAAHTSLINNLIDNVLAYRGEQSAPLVGWIWHFVIGTLGWGALFGIVEPILPGRTWRRKGMVFGAGCAFVLLVALIPMAGAGFFGMSLSLAGILVTVAQHLIYGFVLGEAYWRLLPARERMAEPPFFSLG